MYLEYLIVMCLTFLVSVTATRFVLIYLKKKAILDHPNQRSSHQVATPRGGGLGILISLFPALVYIGLNYPVDHLAYWSVLCAALFLAVLSFADDVVSLGSSIRFLIQFTVVSGLVIGFDVFDERLLWPWVPVWMEKTLIIVGWVWFINLFNFMDGIDGISGVEISSISAGIALLALFYGMTDTTVPIALALIGSSLGFLKWNWHRAKVFMGDVGSISIGFLLGWFLLEFASKDFLGAALILPLYYLMDATVTLCKRLIRREKIWTAHREHAYQVAVQNGFRHDQVVYRIILLNLGLIVCAFLASLGYIEPALVLAFGATFFLMAYFHRTHP